MIGEWRSTPARLVKFFQQSRDAWKERARQYQQRIKALGGEVRDLRCSRDKWKAEAKQAQQQILDWQRQVTDRPPPTAQPQNQALIVRPTTTLAPTGIAANAAPPFCPGSPSFTPTRWSSFRGPCKS